MATIREDGPWRTSGTRDRCDFAAMALRFRIFDSEKIFPSRLGVLLTIDNTLLSNRTIAVRSR